jgi:hypothetical protein
MTPEEALAEVLEEEIVDLTAQRMAIWSYMNRGGTVNPVLLVRGKDDEGVFPSFLPDDPSSVPSEVPDDD